jgi:predicted AAA+ superfamily ATPase
MIRWTIHNELSKRLKEKRRFVQVLAGPRQVGKTTVVRQVMEGARIPAHYASADEPTLRDRTWLEQQWDIARLKAGESKAGALLVLDEIQKVANWSSVVKLLWDADTLCNCCKARGCWPGWPSIRAARRASAGPAQNCKCSTPP